MKISCCWLYAISKYGYPVPVRDIPAALVQMADLGFRYVELEGPPPATTCARCMKSATPSRPCATSGACRW